MLNQFEPGKLTIKRPNLKWIVGLGIVLLLGTGFIALRLTSTPSNNSANSKSTAPTPPATTVNALGRLEPRGEVIKVSAPSQSMGGSQIIELRVKEGDRVQAGQIVAVLDSRDYKSTAIYDP